MTCTTRVAKWDNLKLLLIFLVVVGHLCYYYTAGSRTMQELFVFIYTFHMPLFILVFGLFAKKACAGPRFPGAKVFSYLILALACEVVVQLVDYLCWGTLNFTILNQDALSWFLVACAAYIAITWLLRSVRFRYLFLFALVLGIFVGYDQQVGDTLALSRIIVYYPFFLVGFRLDPKRLDQATSKTWVRLVALAVVLAYAAVCFLNVGDVTSLRLLFTGHNPFALTPGYGAPQRVLCYTLSFLMCAAVVCLTPSRSLGVLTRAGSRTLSIYILHVPVVTVLTWLGVNSWLTTTFGSVVGIALWLSLAVPIVAFLALPPFERFFRMLANCAKPKLVEAAAPTAMGKFLQQAGGGSVPMSKKEDQ